MDSFAASHPEVEVFIQYGTATPPTRALGAPLVLHAELLDMIVGSDVVVTHGGPSTVMDVRSSGRTPIVVARDPDFGEHVDHHQQRFAAHLGRGGLARVASTQESLLELILAGLADPAGSRLDTGVDTVAPGVRAFADHMDRLLGVAVSS
jgi:UDP-N-acetylglucosamine transferase subunit ALG13